MTQYKIVYRVDGNHSIGMGHIFTSISLSKKLKNSDFLFVSQFDEGIEKLKQSFSNVVKIPENLSLNQEVEFIKKLNDGFKSDLIVVDLLRDDYGEFCKQISDLSKTLIIDYFGGIGIFSDIVVNCSIIPDDQNYIKNRKDTIFLLGPKFTPLKEECNKYHLLNKKINDEISKVSITFGGSDRYNSTLKVLSVLKNFKDIYFNVVIGPSFKNKDEIVRFFEENKFQGSIIHDPDKFLELMYDSDLVISAGGLTSFELSALGVPFIGIPSASWEKKRLDRMQELGICICLGDVGEFDENDFSNIFKDLIYDVNKRKNMSVNGKKLLAGDGITLISNAIEGVLDGNKTY